MSKALQVARALTPSVNQWLLAKAKFEAIAEVIDAMDREILAADEWLVRPKWRGKGRVPDRITDPKLAYLMTEEDTKLFCDLRDDIIEQMGWEIPERGYCPKLMAEQEVFKAERAIIDAAAALEPFNGISHHKLTAAGIEKYREFIDLCVGLVVNAPGCVRPEPDTASFRVPAASAGKGASC